MMQRIFHVIDRPGFCAFMIGQNFLDVLASIILPPALYLVYLVSYVFSCFSLAVFFPHLPNSLLPPSPLPLPSQHSMKPTRDYNGCSVLRRYFAQLHLLRARFPPETVGQIPVDFAWSVTTALSLSLTTQTLTLVCHRVLKHEDSHIV